LHINAWFLTQNGKHIFDIIMHSAAWRFCNSEFGPPYLRRILLVLSYELNKLHYIDNVS
jgi:hypothetical protein